MQKIFYDSRLLDAECRRQFGLSEDVMMENAAAGLERFVREALVSLGTGACVLVFCGSGNNGADGYALARRLCGSCSVRAVQVLAPKSGLCAMQRERAVGCGVAVCGADDVPDMELPHGGCVVVDCVFGSGFHGTLPDDAARAVRGMNSLDALRIACDVPSGITQEGEVTGEAFRADITVCMGALKLCLFSDAAKDFAGRIEVQDLGVDRSLFERASVQPEAWLLEREDMVLPFRERRNVHKGTFGHAACVCGEKPGAAVIASCSALRFGAGLVTLVDAPSSSRSFGGRITLGQDGFFPAAETAVPYDILRSSSFPQNTTAVALGMGLGSDDGTIRSCLSFLLEHGEIPCVLDADICRSPQVRGFLRSRSQSGSAVVITPHPKEFAALYEACGLGSLAVPEVASSRMGLVRRFCTEFPNVVLLLKGANVVIAQHAGGTMSVSVNAFGSPALAKGGSGDVLSGMIAALLSQGQDALSAARNASLAHAIASESFGSSYALTPFSLMEAVASLCRTAPNASGQGTFPGK